ncbi:hypothetical protein D9M72_581930 [compost metagenome]
MVDKVSADVNRVLANPELHTRLVDLGIIVKGSSPAAFADVVKVDWAEAIRASNIRLD